jgi:lysophospholipase L1-like esterase
MKRLLVVFVAVLAACGGSAIPMTTPKPTTTTTETEDITVPATAPSVYVLGDSLTVGVEPYLKRALAQQGWKLTGVDGRVNRTVDEGLRILRTKASRLPDTVVLALGSNDLTARQADVQRWLRQARAAAGPDRRLIWINIYVDLTERPELKRYRVIDDALAVAAPQYDIEIGDWDTYVERHDVPQQGDGVHYTDKGYRVRATFYARVVAEGEES